MAATEGMTGGGYYDDHSEYQRRVAATSDALIDRSVADATMPEAGHAFVIVDYGASTGANSIASVAHAVRAARRRDPNLAIVTVHNDLPTNDWNELFRNVGSRADSYVHLDGPAVVPMASAASFFGPAAPARSVQLGVSFSAAHWLRHQPAVDVPEGFYFCEATGAARSTLAASADADWSAFLAARAHDLAPGARLVVQMVGTDEPAGSEAQVTARRLLRAMAEVAAAMADDGMLDRGACERYVLGVYARTPTEAAAPLRRRPLDRCFEIVECRTDPVPNPYYVTWQSDHDGDAYARAYSGFVRGFTESSLREHLFAPGASGGDADALLDEFFTRLTARFRADPEADRFEDWTLTVVLARTSDPAP